MSKAVLIAASVIFLGGCEGSLIDTPQTISAGDLLKQYVESKAAARRQYDGKAVRIRGRVTGGAKMPGPGESEGLIRLGESEESGSAHVQCRFTRGEIEKFSRIAAGEHIIVEGIFSGELATELRFCKLLADQ